MTILYRLLGMLLTVAAIIIAACIIVSIPVLLSSPLNMLSAFMLSSIVLYTWFSNKFLKLVLQQQQTVKLSLRDWLRVNGIVSLIYSLFIIVGMAAFINNPDVLINQMNQMGVAVPVNSLKTMLGILLVFGIILFIHIVWTFALVKKNIGYFKA